MDNTLAPYECQFTIEERKKMVAQTMAQLRKGRGLSQKEAAALIGVSQATYSAYERGRNEPPVEVLVRLSYLFDSPVDILVQRDRLARTSQDAQKQIDDLKQQLKDCENQLTENGGENPVAKQYLDMMNGLLEQMETLNKAQATADSYNEALTK